MKREWECHNCGSTAKFDEDELPPGWRWFGLAGNLEGIFDQLETPLICPECVANVDAALEQRIKKRKPRSIDEQVGMAVTVRKLADALMTVPVKVAHETAEQFQYRMDEWSAIWKETIREAGDGDRIRRIRGHIEGRRS